MNEVLAARLAPAVPRRRPLTALATRHLDGVALALLGLLAALLLVKPAVRALYRVPLDYNEGWNAYFAVRALAGSSALYPDPTSLITNNYPPLSFLIVAGLARLGFDPIIAGRVLGLASLLIVALSAGLAVWALSRARFAACLAAVLVVAVAGAWAPDYVAMNDPHWLGLALTTPALVVLLWSGRTVRPMLLAALLMLAGGLVKHTLIALPLAVTVWLFVHDRRRFRQWLAIAVALLAATLSLLWLVYGAAAFAGILATPRPFAATQMVGKSLVACAPLAGLAGCALVYALLAGGDAGARLVVWYGGVALAWGAFCLGGDGVDSNAMFDAVIVAAVAGAALSHRLEAVAVLSRVPRAWLRSGVVFVAGLAVIGAAPAQLGFGRGYAQVEADHREDIAFIGAVDGPVLCENLSLCFWAGKPFVVDVFNTGNKLRAGRIDQAAVIALIAGHRFAAIQIGMPGDDGFGKPATPRLPLAINRAIVRHYEIARISPLGGVVLVPRASSS